MSKQTKSLKYWYCGKAKLQAKSDYYVCANCDATTVPLPEPGHLAAVEIYDRQTKRERYKPYGLVEG